MIVRPPQHWFRRLFGWHGSVLPQIGFRLSLNLMMSLVAVICFQWYESLSVHLTTAPFSLLGVALAIFLGFRNNASYARFTEARLLWGTMLITHRTLLRQVKSLFLHDTAKARDMAALQMAFSWSLKHQLRHSNARDDLIRLVPARWRDEVLNSPMPASRLLLCMGNWLGEQRQQGVISDIQWQSIDHSLSHLATVQGGCERIENTPIPFAYTLILHRTIYLFCTLLPFALVTDLHYLTPLVSVFISYTFLALECVSEELENPFGLDANDLPLNALCTSIERSLREMNDDFPLPERQQPDARRVLT